MPHRETVLAIPSRTKKRTSPIELRLDLRKSVATTSNGFMNKKPYSFRSQEHNYQRRGNDRDSRASSQQAFSAPVKEVYLICESSHPAFRCPQILEAPVGIRVDLIKRNKLCMNCMRPNHETKDCRFKHCHRCKLAHHTLLHNDQATVAPLSSNSASLSAEAYGYGLLPTAVVRIRNGNITRDCRVLLGTESQSDFISEKMAMLLRLPRTRVYIPVSGVHNDSREFRDLVKVQLESLRTRFSEEINCLVLPAIRQAIPMQYVDRAKLAIPSTFKLAEPQFYKSVSIDAILGVQIMHKIMCTGKIPVLNGSAALQKTRLGWIIFGEIRAVTPLNVTSYV